MYALQYAEEIGFSKYYLHLNLKSKPQAEMRDRGRTALALWGWNVCWERRLPLL